jgi:cytochrome P450
MATIAPPEPVSFSPWQRIWRDVQAERKADGPLPPGRMDFSARRTMTFAREPLPELISAYQEFGPVFTVRIFYAAVLFMIGPAANHYVTVSHASNFRYRDGSLGDLIPFLGDGLLTIDGPYHRRQRKIMLPAFHREQIAASVDTMVAEIERALDRCSDGARLDLYEWTRTLALRVAMRALFGMDPDRGARDGTDAAHEFEEALQFFTQDYVLQILRGPRSPWDRMVKARAKLDTIVFDEIARRRREGHEGLDLLSLLMAAEDEDGDRLSEQELRDEVMTLLFAGHDTTTSTVSFLAYELMRHPREREIVVEELDRVLAGRAPSAADLAGGLPLLEQAVDETLRLYPPAWVGPRRTVESFEFEGVHVPANQPINYSSWVSHHLPDVWEDPEAFKPERFAPEAKAALPKGAYIPFGGGSRTCIGMRFGLLEVRAITAMLLQRFRPELDPGYALSIRQMPTLSPRRGLPVTLRAR